MRHAREEYLFQYAYNTPVSSDFWHCPTDIFYYLLTQSGWPSMSWKVAILDD